jgi:hypothetical protein
MAELNHNNLVLASADPQHQAIAKEYFPYLIESIQTQGVNLKVFSKTKQNTFQDDNLIYHSTFNQPQAFVFDQPQQLQKNKTGFTIPVDSFNEYPFAARAQLADISNKEGQVILARTKIKLNKGSLNGLRFCISITNQKTDSSYFYTDVISADFMINKDSVLTLYTSAFMGTDYYKIKDKAKITVFLWNTQKEKFTISDMEIKTIDYWNRKWNLWD